MNADQTKAAFMTGFAGQGGANLAKLLLKNGCIVQQVPPRTEEPPS